MLNNKFNLVDFINGRDVCTLDGLEVTGLVYSKFSSPPAIVGWIKLPHTTEVRPCIWFADSGRPQTNNLRDSLVMQTTKFHDWVIVYRDEVGTQYAGGFVSRVDALEHLKSHGGQIQRTQNGKPYFYPALDVVCVTWES